VDYAMSQRAILGLSVFLNKLELLLNRLNDALNGASRILGTRYRLVTQRVHRSESWLNYKSRITLYSFR